MKDNTIKISVEGRQVKIQFGTLAQLTMSALGAAELGERILEAAYEVLAPDGYLTAETGQEIVEHMGGIVPDDGQAMCDVTICGGFHSE